MSRLLELHNIFDIGPDEENSGLHLLYAPLSCNCAIATPEDIRKLEAVAQGKESETEYADIFEMLSERPEIHRIRKVSDFRNLSILPTNACNFSCSYCYSAKGRSEGRIDLATVINMIEWFVKLPRENEESLHITIFGGGEPMLCWNDTVRPSIETIEKLRKGSRRKILITLITNGSIIPEDFAEVCLRAGIDLAVSFEVLRELQDIQRGCYDKVSGNIVRLRSAGIVPAINSVITDKAVGRMEEMVEVAARMIPGLTHLSFEPAAGTHTTEYYDKFITHFFAAMRIAEENGIKLTTSALRNVDVTVERYCAGELGLTALGEITLCPCISSPTQPGYERWIYGKATREEIYVDREKLTEMLSYDFRKQPWCEGCFARYNCGGGCIHNTIERKMTQDTAYCTFFRKFLKRVLKARMV